jgi:hypothetical protein
VTDVVATVVVVDADVRLRATTVDCTSVRSFGSASSSGTLRFRLTVGGSSGGSSCSIGGNSAWSNEELLLENAETAVDAVWLLVEVEALLLLLLLLLFLLACR